MDNKEGQEYSGGDEFKMHKQEETFSPDLVELMNAEDRFSTIRSAYLGKMGELDKDGYEGIDKFVKLLDLKLKLGQEDLKSRRESLFGKYKLEELKMKMGVYSELLIALGYDENETKEKEFGRFGIGFEKYWIHDPIGQDKLNDRIEVSQAELNKIKSEK